MTLDSSSIAPPFVLASFHQAEQPELTHAVQRLRYQVYHHDMGLDTPDMDHQRGLDIEDNDLLCECLVVRDTSLPQHDIVGCLRLQESSGERFYAEKEFTLQGPWWRQRRLSWCSHYDERERKSSFTIYSF